MIKINADSRIIFNQKHTWLFKDKILNCGFFYVIPLDETTLYSRAHGADCELCLAGHDISGLDVSVIHGVLKSSAPISVLVAHITIEGDFGSSSGKTIHCHSQKNSIFYCWDGDGGELLNIEMKNSSLKHQMENLHLTQGYYDLLGH